MVADIHKGNNLYGSLAYNLDKIDRGVGSVLESSRIFVPYDGQFRVTDCVRDFERAMPSPITCTRPVIHISLNPHPDDRLADHRLAAIGREYLERMGFGGQPYMIFKHEDIDRRHIHIVSSRVRGDGSIISDKKDYERSQKITDDLERKYGLRPKGPGQGEAWQLAPVDVSRGDLKRQVANVVKPLAAMYRFPGFGEYRALLSLYRVGVEKVEGANAGHRYAGLVYSALDEQGNRVGNPLKASLFGKKVGYEALNEWAAASKELLRAEDRPARVRCVVAPALAVSRTGSEFRAALREKGIDLMLRHSDQGRLYGVTFIDHASRTVLNGSALGKEFSANALSARFADFSLSQNGREDLNVPASAPTQASVPTTAQTPPLVMSSAPIGPSSAMPSGPDTPPFTPQQSPGEYHTPTGSGLFAISNTPNNPPQDTHKPKKKKKRKYGRQV